MKHVIVDSNWEYSTEPFPAYRCSLCFGRNKHDRAMIPTKVVPSVAKEGDKPTLPDGQFKVIKTKEKGTILVVPGTDATHRCLLMVGCNGGFRGGVDRLDDGGVVLAECSASSACESRTEVAVVLEPGQSVAFSYFGRHASGVRQYTWDGKAVIGTHYTLDEWKQRKEVAAEDPDGEVL